MSHRVSEGDLKKSKIISTPKKENMVISKLNLWCRTPSLNNILPSIFCPLTAIHRHVLLVEVK
jgi:hypothetical protein